MNCKDITRLMSENQERKLSLRERFVLKMHTMMCIGCTNYGKQMTFMRTLAKRYREGMRDDE